jgi:hypothetical protein
MTGSQIKMFKVISQTVSCILFIERLNFYIFNKFTFRRLNTKPFFQFIDANYKDIEKRVEFSFFCFLFNVFICLRVTEIHLYILKDDSPLIF